MRASNTCRGPRRGIVLTALVALVVLGDPAAAQNYDVDIQITDTHMRSEASDGNKPEAQVFLTLYDGRGNYWYAQTNKLSEQPRCREPHQGKRFYFRNLQRSTSHYPRLHWRVIDDDGRDGTDLLTGGESRFPDDLSNRPIWLNSISEWFTITFRVYERPHVKSLPQPACAASRSLPAIETGQIGQVVLTLTDVREGLDSLTLVEVLPLGFAYLGHTPAFNAGEVDSLVEPLVGGLPDEPDLGTQLTWTLANPDTGTQTVSYWVRAPTSAAELRGHFACELRQSDHDSVVQAVTTVPAFPAAEFAIGGIVTDCDGNGQDDDAELASEPSLDCNGNGVLDVCDIAEGTAKDCQPNGVPDECDLATGYSQDTNFDGLPDECSTTGAGGCPQPAPPGLLKAYPNPSNPGARISFSLHESGTVRIELYDLKGRRLAVLTEGQFPTGTGEVVWDGLDGEGRRLASGAYLVVMRQGDRATTQKLTLLK